MANAARNFPTRTHANAHGRHGVCVSATQGLAKGPFANVVKSSKRPGFSAQYAQMYARAREVLADMNARSLLGKVRQRVLDMPGLLTECAK